MEPPILAVIDLGTNTFKFVVGRDRGDYLEILEDDALSGRLGRELAATGAIGAEAMAEALIVLKDIRRRIAVWKPARTVCVGAMTLRTAADAAQFIAILKAATGLQTRILSGEEEALLAWKAATMDLPVRDNRAVLDIGGGSFELSVGAADPLWSHSFPLGALTLTRRCIHHDPPLPQELEAARDQISSFLRASPVPFLASELTVIGGSAVNLAAMQAQLASGSEVAPEQSISLNELDYWLKLLSSKTLAERKLTPGLTPSRADIIIAGIIVLEQCLKHLRLSSFRVSRRGIRHALLKEL